MDACTAERSASRHDTAAPPPAAECTAHEQLRVEANKLLEYLYSGAIKGCEDWGRFHKATAALRQALDLAEGGGQ